MKVCDYCGKEIYKKLSHNKHAKKHFCSRECFVKYRKKYNYYPREQDKETYQKIKTLAEMNKK